MFGKKKKNKKNDSSKKDIMSLMYVTTKELKKIKIGSIEEAFNCLVSLLKFEDKIIREKEHFWVIGMDIEGFVVCVYMVSLGSSNVTLFSPVEVFQYAVNRGCTQVILAHNHPHETVLKASEQDLEMTNFLYHTARFVGIHVVDHLIINLIAFLSLRKVGEMQKIIEDMKFKIYDEVKPELDKLKEEEKTDALKIGRKEGVAAGRMLGVAEGEKIGIDKGKIEMVKNLLIKNIDINIISESSGFTIEEILKINTDRCTE